MFCFERQHPQAVLWGITLENDSKKEVRAELQHSQLRQIRLQRPLLSSGTDNALLGSVRLAISVAGEGLN